MGGPKTKTILHRYAAKIPHYGIYQFYGKSLIEAKQHILNFLYMDKLPEGTKIILIAKNDGILKNKLPRWYINYFIIKR